MNEKDNVLTALLDVVKNPGFNAANPSDLHALIYLLYYQVLAQDLHSEDVEMLIDIVQKNLIHANVNDCVGDCPPPHHLPPMQQCDCNNAYNGPVLMNPVPNGEIRFRFLGFNPPDSTGQLDVGPDPIYFPQNPVGVRHEFGKSYIPFSVAKLLSE